MTVSLVRFGGSILATGMIAVGLAATSPVQAADDGYANIFSSIFGAVGLVKRDQPPDVAYRDRPPLVLPPQPGLPKPGDGFKHTAAWPQDPDVLAHRKAARDALAPRQSTDHDGNIIAPGELAKQRGEAADEGPGRSADCLNGNNSRNCLLLSPDELKRQGDAFAAANPDAADKLVPGKEPERVYLTQPPKGYMMPTRVLKATAEAPPDRSDPSDPRAFLRPTQKTDE